MAMLQVLKLLGDDTRLRLLSLLSQEELSVQELVSITGVGQSRVSHHLGLLRGAGLVQDRKDGTWTFYRLQEPGNKGSPLNPALWKAVGEEYQDSELAERDQEALERVRESRRERSRSVHDRLAGVWRLVGEDLERGSLRAEALAALATSKLVVADLGCGAGFFTSYLSERVERVIAVDHSPAMLQEAQGQLPAVNVEFRLGEVEALPLQDGEVDAVFANLVLHHVADLSQAVEEMGRVVKSGGVAVITDLQPHREEWMREELGDLRLGIAPEEIRAGFQAGPFTEVEEMPVEDRYMMKSRGGRTARLELFLIRARRK